MNKLKRIFDSYIQEEKGVQSIETIILTVVAVIIGGACSYMLINKGNKWLSYLDD